MKIIIVKIIYKVVYFLHKLFPKHIPIMTCYGCMGDNCPYRSRKGNMICYYHKKKNREIKTLVDLLFLEQENKEDLFKSEVE